MSDLPNEFIVRRTLVSDLPLIRSHLIGDDSYILQKRFGSPISLSNTLETSFLCVSALNVSGGDEKVSGFFAFSDAPNNDPFLSRSTDRGHKKYEHWESTLDNIVPAGCAARGRIRACNTLWLTFVTSSFGNGCSKDTQPESDMMRQVLSTVFATCPQINRVAVSVPEGAPVFAPVSTVFFPLPTQSVGDERYDGNLFTIQREDVNRPLILRPGVVEDYDDFIPLLLAGVGVVTPLPQTLYLDELLQDDDPYTAVVVAEDPNTHQVVGIMCLDASYDQQQHCVKQYTTEPFGKLKPLAQPQSNQFKLDVVSAVQDVIADTDPVRPDGIITRMRHKPKAQPFAPKKEGKKNSIASGQHNNHNSFQITFFYLNPDYNACSAQFIPYIFNIFRFAEYASINLPHAAPEHPLLQHFAYTPIKKFQPTNAQGERLPLPEGMWLCCRYALEDVVTAPFTRMDEEATSKLLRVQSELQQTTVESILVALTQVGHPKDKETLSAIMLSWRRQPVGLVILRSVTIDEMHALRRNFDLDEFVNFYPKESTDYSPTNFHLDADKAKTSFYRDEMPGQIVKFAFVKPIFRSRLRFLLREALRHTESEVLLHVATPSSDLFNPLISELVFTPPRRVVDKVEDQKRLTAADSPPKQRDIGDQDVEGLMALYHTSRRALSDEKTKIHARIVVIGASSTGLAFLYHLLTIPYLHFTNLLLISPDGLPDHPNHREHQWFIDNMVWLEREYLLLKLPGRLRVLDGQMTDFDKFDKYVFTVGGVCEPYDYLTIATGRQYTIPRELAAHHGAKNGVFPLSGSLNLAKIQQHIHEGEIYEDDLSHAVIYGNSLDVFAAASTVIRLGLAPQRIVIVSPEEESGGANSASHGPFMDPLVDLKLDKLLASLGTKLLRGYSLERLDYDEDNNLSLVVVTPSTGGIKTQEADGKMVEIAASMFIYAHDKDIDANVLSALNQRSIVFDGRVIVENNYRTTDPNIFAVGPVAMFSLRFGSSRDFEEYSILEVGRHLGNTLLGFMGIDELFDEQLHGEEDKTHAPKDDPLAAELGSRAHETAETTQRKRPKPLPKYTEIVTRRVVVPGAHSYFIAHSVDFGTLIDRCQHLTSADGNGNNYIRISIGPNKYIEAVTYFGNQSVELHNLRALVGLPESCLNLAYNYSEYSQYNKGKSLDLLQYLRAPWAHMVFYDKFAALFSRIKQLLLDHPDADRVKGEVLDAIIPSGSDSLTDPDRLGYHKRLTHEHSDARRLVEKELIGFLHQHKVFLPQRYFLPDMSAHFSQAM